MPENTRNVNYQFKLLYAIGIFFVVLFHIPGNATIELFTNFFPVYTYHLALFAFASGYFYRSASEERIGSFVLKKARKLLLPFFIWNCIYGLLVVPLLKRCGVMIGAQANLETLFVSPFTDGHAFIYNMGSWFVIPLFLVQVYYALVRKLLRLVRLRCEYLIFLLFLLQGFWGNDLAIQGFHTDWWLLLARCHYLLPFFALGQLYKQKLEKLDRLPSPVYFLLVFAAAIAVIVNYEGVVACTPSWCNDFKDAFIPFISGLIGVAFWLRVSRRMANVGRSKWVLLVADHSFDIMMHQFLGFMLVKAILLWLSQQGVSNITFDLAAFQTSIWYYCFPFDLPQFGLIYVVGGFTVPLLIGAVSRWLTGLTAGACRKLIGRPGDTHAAKL